MGRKAAMINIPKGYKQTEVGVIPEDWGVKKDVERPSENRPGTVGQYPGRNNLIE